MYIATIDANRRVVGYTRGTFAQFVERYGKFPRPDVMFISPAIFWTIDDITDFVQNYFAYYLDTDDKLRRDWTMDKN